MARARAETTELSRTPAAAVTSASAESDAKAPVTSDLTRTEKKNFVSKRIRLLAEDKKIFVSKVLLN